MAAENHLSKGVVKVICEIMLFSRVTVVEEWVGSRKLLLLGGIRVQRRRPRADQGEATWLHTSGAPSAILGLSALPMLLPRVRMVIPLKLLALVTGCCILQKEPSGSLLLQGHGSRDFSLMSVLLYQLLEVQLSGSHDVI